MDELRAAETAQRCAASTAHTRERAGADILTKFEHDLDAASKTAGNSFSRDHKRDSFIASTLPQRWNNNTVQRRRTVLDTYKLAAYNGYDTAGRGMAQL